MGLVSKHILRFNTPTICCQYVISAYGDIWINSYYVWAFLQNKDLFATVELTSEDKYLKAMPRNIYLAADFKSILPVVALLLKKYS